MRGLLITGTDTGVGKSTLACGLLRLARRRGLRLVPYKPVETGCLPRAHDAERLCLAAAIPGLGPNDICPFQFLDPVAPSVAARLASKPLSSRAILSHGEGLRQRGDALLVESAGGLLTPYGPELTSSSLAELLDIDILLVAANRLGTINHAALALAEIRRRALPLAGLVLVNLSPHSTPDQAHNATEIHSLTGVSPIGVLRYCDPDDPDDIADSLAADLRLERVLDGRLS